MRSPVRRASLVPRPLVGAATFLLLSLSPVACRRTPPQPSPDYEQAAGRFRSLYAEKLDQAFLDPRMGEIEAQLQRVPEDSLDATSARELSQRIQQGRARMEAAAKAQADAVASAHEVPPTTLPSSRSSAPLRGVAPAEPPDAGPPDAGVGSGPGAGTPASELVAGFRGCFRRGPPLNVLKRGMRETWQMNDSTMCRLEYPGLVETVLIIEEGKVLTVVPKSAITPEPPDSGTAPPPSANPARDAGA